MDFFKVDGLGDAGKLMLIGIVAGVAFWVIDKYLIVPAEQQVGLAA